MHTNDLQLCHLCFEIKKLILLFWSQTSSVLDLYFFGTNPVVFVLIAKPYTAQCFKYTF